MIRAWMTRTGKREEQEAKRAGKAIQGQGKGSWSNDESVGKIRRVENE